jgi:hypothetical protein
MNPNNRKPFTHERNTTNLNQSQGKTTMLQIVNDAQTELTTARAELATLESDSPKFTALLDKHATRAAQLKPEITTATKAGNLEQANTVLDEIAALDSKILAVKEAQAAHENEVGTARSKVVRLEAEIKRDGLIGQAVELSHEMRENLDQHDALMLELVALTRAKVHDWLEIRAKHQPLREKWLAVVKNLGAPEPGTQVPKGLIEADFSVVKANHIAEMVHLRSAGADTSAGLTTLGVISPDQHRTLTEWQNPIGDHGVIPQAVKKLFADVLEAIRSQQPLDAKGS